MALNIWVLGNSQIETMFGLFIVGRCMGQGNLAKRAYLTDKFIRTICFSSDIHQLDNPAALVKQPLKFLGIGIAHIGGVLRAFLLMAIYGPSILTPCG